MSISGLISGRTYRVIKPFNDFDGALHDIGETWVFIGENFLPYDDGLSLFVAVDGKDRQIRMRCMPEDQGLIVDNFRDYLAAV